MTDPAGELARVCSFLGEGYSPLMLAAEGSFSEHGDTRERSRKAISPARLHVWKKELTEAHVAQIEWVLGPHLENFGYAREGSRASAFTVLRGLGYAPIGYARFVMARLPAVWYRYAAPAKLAKYDYWTGPRVWRKNTKPVQKDA